MLKKIPVSEVCLGMYLHEMSGTSWINHPFWKTKFVLKGPLDLKRLTESAVTHVWIDVSLGADVTPPVTVTPSPPQTATQVLSATPPPVTPARAARAAPPQHLSVEQEVVQTNLIKAQAKEEIGALFQQARLGNAIVTAHLTPLVEDISASVLRNPGVFISLSRLKNKDDYTYLHSVTVCALMVSLGRQLGLDDQLMREAGMAGLLHDVGKAMIPLEILNKPGALTDAEFVIVKNHPRDGYDLLAGQTTPGAIAAQDVALHHHEKMNGKGYPDKLDGTNISLLARMGAVCDVYDAITSNRPYKAGWEPAESVRRMAVWSNEGHFDTRVFQAFVKSIGIYPTGSLVKLQSGRLAVVLNQHPNSALTPTVKAFFSIKSNLHITPELIDLSKANNTERIVSRELPEDWKITNLEEIWTGIPSGKA